MNKVRVRLAPSPTGFLHIGTLRTYLYDYLFAKQQGGEIVLRIEDTDQARSVEGAVENLLKTIEWSGLEYDEGPKKERNHAPYVQSERLDLYKKHVQVLIEKGSAYYAFDSASELDEMRKKQQAEKRAPMYDRDNMRNSFTLGVERTQELIKAGEQHVIRMVIPENREIAFDDMVRGRVTFSSNTIDDQVIMKSDGFPTYHLAVVIDDHEMEISHVFRGEEWLASTPKHILLYEAFGWEVPQYAHLPLLLNPDRSKLSKRKGDVSVESYIQKGYTRDAILNFIALLGWNPKTEQEIMSIDDMIKLFDMKNVHKAGAVVNIERLNWFNAHYIKQMSQEDYVATGKSFLTDVKDFSDEQVSRVLEIQKERLQYFGELPELTNMFFNFDDSYDAMNLVWKKSNKESTLHALNEAEKALSEARDADLSETASIEKLFDATREAASLKPGDFFWPLRYALSGVDKSPNYFLMIWALGREKSLSRINTAKKKLEAI